MNFNDIINMCIYSSIEIQNNIKNSKNTIQKTTP